MMKKTNEIKKMLAEEIKLHVNTLGKSKPMDRYYNKILGDTSFLLAGLLSSLLAEKKSDWDASRWIDDCLISKAAISQEKVFFHGVMIWGKENTTKQWVDPFSFEARLKEDSPGIDEFSFFFQYANSPSITYEEFRADRGHWDYNIQNWLYALRG